MTEQTAFGIEVTLTATLEILEFLTKENNFKYLMTSRLNQDPLEVCTNSLSLIIVMFKIFVHVRYSNRNKFFFQRFFSLARGACGSNDHPDSILFGQMFLLLGTYSLIKPIRGSNIAGGEMLNTLLQVTDINYHNEDKEEWHMVIDSLLRKKIRLGQCRLSANSSTPT